MNINNQEIFIDKPELEISMVDYLKNNKSNNSDKQTNGILELCQGIKKDLIVLGIERGGITFEQDFAFNCLENNDVFFNENILINWSKLIKNQHLTNSA